MFTVPGFSFVYLHTYLTAFCPRVCSFIDAVKHDGDSLTPDVLSERFQEFLAVRIGACMCVG